MMILSFLRVRPHFMFTDACRQKSSRKKAIKGADPANILLQALLLNISVHTLPEKKIGKADKKSGTAQ